MPSRSINFAIINFAHQHNNEAVFGMINYVSDPGVLGRVLEIMSEGGNWLGCKMLLEHSAQRQWNPPSPVRTPTINLNPTSGYGRVINVCWFTHNKGKAPIEKFSSEDYALVRISAKGSIYAHGGFGFNICYHRLLQSEGVDHDCPVGDVAVVDHSRLIPKSWIGVRKDIPIIVITNRLDRRMKKFLDGFTLVTLKSKGTTNMFCSIIACL